MQLSAGVWWWRSDNTGWLCKTFWIKINQGTEIKNCNFRPDRNLNAKLRMWVETLHYFKFILRTILCIFSCLDVRDGRGRIPQLISSTVFHLVQISPVRKREKPLSHNRMWKFCPPPSAEVVHRGLIGAKSCQSLSFWASTISLEHLTEGCYKGPNL